MQWLLRVMGRAVSRHPGLLIALLVVATLVLGGLASQLEVETDITEFAADTPLAQGFDRIEDEFGGRGTQIQVIVDAGRGGNVLAPAGLAVAERIEDLAHDTPEIEANLAPEGFAGPAVVSYARPFVASFGGFDADVADLPAPFVASFVRDTLDSVGERIEPLLSTDADLATGTARAGLVSVELDPDLDDDTLRAASLALRDALAGEDFGWFDVRPFSFVLLTDDIEQGLFEDLPVLMAASFLLIIVILWLLFRRVSDVALGVAAMGLAVVWMTGAAVLLGPGFLGVAGEFNQIAVAVPVLLVGLGIDYTVHLVVRYRENLAGGHDPPQAAEVAIRTVGVALVLATITTVAGFLSNLVTPLPPIADFGMFAAAGIVAAFLVTGLLVPGVRALVDRRRTARGLPVAGATGMQSDGVTRLGEVLGRLAVVAARAPVMVLGVTAALAVVGIVAATDLDTEFSQEDFIPADSDAGQLLELMDTRFGGDVSERTFVLVDGDLTDTEVANAILDARAGLSDVPDVVTAGGVAELRAPPTVVELIVDEAEDAQERLAGQLTSFADPDGAAADLPLPAIRGPDDLPADLRDEADGADDDVLDGFAGDLTGLDRRLPPGTTSTDALLRALPADELEAAVRDALADELRAAAPDGATDDVLAAAAALDPAEIDRATLAELGFPVAELDGDTLDLIDTAARLRALGWDGERVAADADLAALYDVVAEEAPAELDGVLAADRRSGLMSISTTAGQPRAAQLATGLQDGLAPLRGTGAELLVVSEPLLLEETLATLADAQTTAIVISLLAAGLLMVGYYGLVHRRPGLGAIAMVPSLLAVVYTLGTMRLIGLSYNALTATVASIAIGIGVPYGIHVTNRFVEERRTTHDPTATIRGTMTNTGAALAGSAITTASAFGVLSLSNLGPLRQFGIISAIVIVFALLAAVLAESSCLVLWDRRRRRREQPGARRSPVHGRTPRAEGRT